MQAVFSLLAIPIMILNSAGGFAGGIWLALNGNWSLLVVGFFAMAGASALIGIALYAGHDS